MGGVYHQLAEEIARATEESNPGILIETIETEGAEENIRLLLDGSADIALTQSDVLFYYSNLRKEFPLFKRNIAGLAPLYYEALHLVARAELRIETVQDLAGRTVGIGPQLSGTNSLARLVLLNVGVLGVTELRDLGFSGATDLLKSGSIDAAFYVSGYPMPLISELMTAGHDYTLVPLDARLTTTMRDEYPELVVVTIPAGIYTDQPDPVPTLGVMTLLVCRSGLTKNVVHAAASAIRDNHGSFFHPIDEQAFNNPANITRIVPLHNGARDFYDNLSFWTRHAAFRDLLPFMIGLLAILMIQRVLLRPAYERIRYINIFRAIGFIVLFWIVGAVAMNYCEKEINRNFSTIGESFWSIAIYFFSGFEDKEPSTLWGKAISILLLMSWIGVVAFFTAEFAAIFSVTKIEKTRRRIRMKGHYVICNWSPNGESIVRELHDSNSPARNDQVVVLTDKVIEEKQYSRIPQFAHVTFHAGNMLSPQVLRDLGVHNAKAIIILEDTDVEDPDGKSVQLGLVLQKLMKAEHKDPLTWPKLVAEVANHRRIDLIREAYGERSVEAICAEDYAVGLMAQTAIYPKLAKVYDDLLDYSDDTNEIYMIDWNEMARELKGLIKDGINFEDLAEKLYDSSIEANPVVLLGYKRGENLYVNPKKVDKANYLMEGDSIIIMSFRKPTKNQLLLGSR
jgi:hypothetical protein